MSRTRLLGGVAVAALALAGLVTSSAGATTTKGPGVQLAAVGPVDAVTGFPTWYRDPNGISVTPCVDGTNPMCGLAAGVMPQPTQPTVWPTNFPNESFYASATSVITLPGGGRAELVTGLEAAFATAGRVTPGQQVTFGRVRIRIDTPSAGTYTITHPFGVDTFDVPAGGTRTINYTEDVGLGSAGFTGALQSRTAPFLKWDTGLVSGPDGAQYLGDPAVTHRVTGSALGTDFFRIDGPNIGGSGVNTIQNDLFTVTGKVASRMGVDPGSPTYSLTESGGFVDVFASSTPGQTLTLDGAGLATTGLRGDAGGRYFGRVALTGKPPAEVTVTNTSDRPATAVTTKLTDRVVVSSAAYDADRRTLTVQAASSDTVTPTMLSVDGLGQIGTTSGGAASTTLTGIDAPPATVTVSSGLGGHGSAPVVVSGSPLAADTVTAVAGPDRTVTQGQVVPLDGTASRNATTSLAWTQVDTGNGMPAVPVTPTGPGTATFTAPAQGGQLTFRLTAQGPAGTATDDVVITVGGVAAPVADAGPDQPAVLVGDPVTLDAGASTGATSYSWTQIGGTAADTVLLSPDQSAAKPTFTMPRTTAPLTFQLVVNGPGGSSKPDTVTITPVKDTVTVTQAQYRTGKREWRVAGTATVKAGNTVTVWVGTSAGGVKVGSAVVDTTGAWAVRLQGSNVTPTPASVYVESTRGGSATATVTVTN